MKIAIVLGTRPEIIKLTSFIRECEKRRKDYFIIHTNQHYSCNLDKIFFTDLELPAPKYNLNIGSGTHAQETGKMMIGIEDILIKEKPDVVVVEGDTNTVMAGALAASKINIPVAHMEAGVRSYFRAMPEELNRIVTDHVSEFLFVQFKDSKKILIKEGIPAKKIFVVGNTIVDAVYQNIVIAEKKVDILEKMGVKKEEYFLMTCHRQENVDDKKRFSNILEGMKNAYAKWHLPILYSLHPRAKKMIQQFGLKVPEGVKTFEPLGYLDFLQLEKNAKLILTDSGGAQGEACIMKIPCVILRDNYECPEATKIGANRLSGADSKKIFRSIEFMLRQSRNWKNPWGNGHSAEKILNIMEARIYEK